MNAAAQIADAILAGIDRSEARRKLEEILSRSEFQGWIDLLAIIEKLLDKLFTKLSNSFFALPFPLKVVLLLLLLAILVAIVAHWVIVARRLLGGGLPREHPEGGGDLASLIRSAWPPAELKAKALERLRAGDASEAVRLLFITLLVLLRRRGVIPEMRSMTAREIGRLLGEQIKGFDRATRLFELSAYSHRRPGERDAEWMLSLVEETEGE